jgi:antitoxin VapB
MSLPKRAKLFLNGRSQAVRLPSEFRFEGSEVYVRQDPATGDVILSRRPEGWDRFFALQAQVPQEELDQFMSDRIDEPPQEREIF